jgi:hypothetical protein
MASEWALSAHTECLAVGRSKRHVWQQYQQTLRRVMGSWIAFSLLTVVVRNQVHMMRVLFAQEAVLFFLSRTKEDVRIKQ